MPPGKNCSGGLSGVRLGTESGSAGAGLLSPSVRAAGSGRTGRKAKRAMRNGHFFCSLHRVTQNPAYERFGFASSLFFPGLRFVRPGGRPAPARAATGHKEYSERAGALRQHRRDRQPFARGVSRCGRELLPALHARAVLGLHRVSGRFLLPFFFKGDNETYIEGPTGNDDIILYDNQMRDRPRTRRTKRNV